MVDRGVADNACVLDQASPSVTICSARNSASVPNPVRIVAETRDHEAEVLRVSILVDNNEKYLAYGNRVDTDLTLSPGAHHIVVHGQDINGTAFESAADLNVTAAVSAPLSAPPSIALAAPLDGASSSSPVRIVGSVNSSNPASAMIVYADDKEVFRTFTGNMDTYLDLKSGLHRIVINAWDNTGTLIQNVVTVRVSERMEACNEYKPVPSVTICSPQTTNSVAGGPFHFVGTARSNAGPVSTIIVYADGLEVFRTYSNYADAQLNLAPGAHQLIVNAWDIVGALMQATQAVTIK